VRVLKISEFAEITGLSKDTIRYYEKMDLLHPEMKGMHREYNKQNIESVEVILKLKQTGFSLQEIKMLFEWSHNTDQNKKLTNEELQNLLKIQVIFQEKYKQMEQKEAQIKQIKQVLKQANNKMEQLLNRIRD
jgi:MerR family transcriptional regulator, repressor of the yfmOP operon